MTICDLQNIADNEGYEIMSIDCPESGSMAIQTDEGNCYIGLDNHSVTAAVELTRTAHEIGHCRSGSFYNKSCPFEIVEKLERTANKEAAFILIPLPELLKAFRHGYTEIWELAEYFGVTEDFVRTTIDIYISKGFLERV